MLVFAINNCFYLIISFSIPQLFVLKGAMKEMGTAHYLGNASVYLLFFFSLHCLLMKFISVEPVLHLVELYTKKAKL